MRVDPEVFKLKDPRISAVATGRMSVQQLVHMIRPGDFIIFRDGTVYALTQSEYYAAQRVQEEFVLSKDQFQEVFTWPREKFSKKDADKLAQIELKKGRCTKCQYNTYKSKVLDILKGYPDLLKKFIDDSYAIKCPPYPATTGKIISKVSKVFPKFFGQQPYDRKPCLDCVQKHVSIAKTCELLGQAYVKGCETRQGYPEHKLMAISNMQEAFEECPSDCQELRDIIMFCIGKSKKDNEIFLPIENILYLIQLARLQTSSEEALDQNEPDSAFSLQLSKEMLEQLKALPVPEKARLVGILDKLLEVEYNETPQQKTLYQGYMGTLADMLVNIYPDISNVLRNRRLMFKAAPQMIQNTEYDCKDLKEALIQPVKVQEKVSSEEGTAERA